MTTITDYFLEFGESRLVLDQNFNPKLVSPAMGGVILTAEEDPGSRKIEFHLYVELAPFTYEGRKWWIGACWTPDGSAHVFYGDP